MYIPLKPQKLWGEKGNEPIVASSRSCEKITKYKGEQRLKWKQIAVDHSKSGEFTWISTYITMCFWLNVFYKTVSFIENN